MSAVYLHSVCHFTMLVHKHVHYENIKKSGWRQSELEGRGTSTLSQNKTVKPHSLMTPCSASTHYTKNNGLLKFPRPPLACLYGINLYKLIHLSTVILSHLNLLRRSSVIIPVSTIPNLSVIQIHSTHSPLLCTSKCHFTEYNNYTHTQ